MTALDIAREYFPDLSDKELGDIVWEYTGYPEFWNIGMDGDTPEECFRTQLQRLKESVKEDTKL